MASASVPIVKGIALSVPEKCLPEGRRILRFQQDLFFLNWVPATLLGKAGLFSTKFSFNLKDSNQQPMTAFQSLIISFVTGNDTDVMAIIDFADGGIPIYLGEPPGASPDLCIYAILPWLTSSDIINVTLYSSIDQTGLGNGLMTMGVANFQIDPIYIGSNDNVS